MWIAVGEGTNSVAHSSDGLSWTGLGRTIFSIAGNAVAYSEIQSKWVAMGQGTNSVAHSSNGMTWTGLGMTLFSGSGEGVAYSMIQDKWVAVGKGVNAIATSRDGVFWTGVTGLSIFSSHGLDVAFSVTQGMWVAVGVGTSTIAHSLDGVTWSAIGSSSSIFSTQGQGVASFVPSLTTPISTTIPGNPCQFLPNCTCFGVVCTASTSVLITSRLSVSTSSVLVVQGSLTLDGTSRMDAQVLVASASPLASATGDVVVSGSLFVVVSSAVPSSTLVLVRAASISGTFASSSVVSSDSCSNVVSGPLSVSATTISVTVQITNTCELSSGSIVGLAVGVIVVAVAVVIVLVCVTRWKRDRYDRRTNEKLKNRDLENVNCNYIAI